MDFSFTVKNIFLCLVIAGLTHPAMAADDAYLKALEVEAHDLAVHNSSANQAGAPAAEASKDKPVPEVKVDTRKDEFETALKAELPNTFTIYTRLAPEQKSMVVETYFAHDRKIAASSRQIFDFYLFDRKR